MNVSNIGLVFFHHLCFLPRGKEYGFSFKLSPVGPQQDLAGQIIASLEELELQYPELHDRIDFYNTVSDWVHKKKVELTLSQKKLS